MSQSRDKVSRRLKSAHATQAPVTIRRKHVDLSHTFGFVVAMTDEWLVVHELYDTVYLDGLVLLRLDDVTKVVVERDVAYLNRAVQGLGRPLREFSCSPDTSVSELIRTASERSGLIGVRMEGWRREPLYVGKLRRLGKKRFDLQFIGSDGVWVDFVDSWKYKDVTRIEFGGQYINALERFGDPTPADPAIVGDARVDEPHVDAPT